MTADQAAAYQAAASAGDLLASLAAPETGADPYPTYARLRALGRVIAGPGGTLFATTYDECAAVTRQPEFLAQSPRWCDRAVPGWRARPGQVATFEAMLFRDPPDHTRLRRLVAAAFTPRQAERMRAGVTAQVERALDRLADAGADGSVVDLQEVLAATLPIAVIGSLAGVPASDWAELRAAMSALLRVVELSVSPRELADADRAAVRLREYFSALVADRRAAPRDDLASTLAAAGDGGSSASEEELLQTLTFVFMAGVDTMTNLLANGTAALLAHPDQAGLLRADPGRAAAAVEEVLRFDPPVQFVGRVAGAGAVLAGRPVEADTLVVAMIGAANRDPARFAAHDVFIITRTGSTALSFGGGIHFCLGAPLARVQGGTFFTALLSRFPRLSLAGTPRRQGVVFRGFGYLPVTLR